MKDIIDRVRETAADLPEAEESTHYGTPAFKVRGKMFVRFHEMGDVLVVRVPMHERASDGRPLKVLSMCDEFTREIRGGTVARSITADDVVAMLETALLVRGAPGFIRCDNGPEFIAAAVRDWCRINRIETTYIDPGSPWQNPWVESFNSRARDELFAREIFDTVRQARFLYDEWRDLYNHRRPHSSLAPAVFAHRCRTTTITEPS